MTTRGPAHAVMNGAVTEREFMTTVVRYATLKGWFVYHTHDSRRSNPGFPDLVLARDDVLIFAELKAEKGRVSKEQVEWLEVLGAANHGRAYLWRPSSWSLIEAVLR